MKHFALKNVAQQLLSSETDRLDALKKYQILDTPREEAFDLIVEMASAMANCEVATVGFLDENRFWFKSIGGMESDAILKGCIPCELATNRNDVYEIEDLSKHVLTADNPIFNNGKRLLYYAGTPLINDEGFALGALCVFDTKPKRLSAKKLNLLKLLAKDVMYRLEQRRSDIIKEESINQRSERLIISHMELLRKNKELIRTKQGFSRQNLLLENILNNSPHLISLIDHQGNLEMVNNAMVELLQRPAKEIEGQNIKEIYFSSKSERTNKNIKNLRLVIKTGKPCPAFDDTIKIKGNKRHYQVVMVPVEDRPGKPLVLRIATEVTDLKLLEVSLNQKNKELENLIYSLSHDLRGPISSILGLTSMQKYAKPQDLTEYFSMIQEQALKMDTSIHDLVELKTVTNKNVNPELVDIRKLLDEIITALPDNNVEINISGDTEAKLNTDKFFLKTTLQRVVNNSVFYHNSDAITPKVDIAIYLQEGGLKLTVKDNGIGISSRALPRVFEMFYRGSNASTGHGLGLYIAQNALGRIKGNIRISSQEGAGTDVGLMIPHVEGDAYFE